MRQLLTSSRPDPPQTRITSSQNTKPPLRAKQTQRLLLIAKQLPGKDIYFNWDAPRTREGYYRYKGGCQCAINRAVAFAPYADAIWMESKLPDYAQAKEFADGVHAVWPEQK